MTCPAIHPRASLVSSVPFAISGARIWRDMAENLGEKLVDAVGTLDFEEECVGIAAACLRRPPGVRQEGGSQWWELACGPGQDEKHTKAAIIWATAKMLWGYWAVLTAIESKQVMNSLKIFGKKQHYRTQLSKRCCPRRTDRWNVSGTSK